MSDYRLTILSGLRAAIGGFAWVAPTQMLRSVGIDAVADPQLRYLARLVGIRDLALAAGLLLSSGTDGRRWLRLGIASDAGDAVAGVLAWRAGEISAASSVLVTVSAVGGVALGLVARRADQEPSSTSAVSIRP